MADEVHLRMWPWTGLRLATWHEVACVWVRLAWMLMLAMVFLSIVLPEPWAQRGLDVTGVVLQSSLLLFGTLHLYVVAWRQLSPWALFLSASSLALLVTTVQVQQDNTDIGWHRVLGLVLALCWLVGLLQRARRRQQALQAACETEATEAERRPQISYPADDASIRGQMALWVTGSGRYQLVPRSEVGAAHPAARFERLLLAYLERKLGGEILAYSGTNSHYWKLHFPPDTGTVVEIGIIGPHGFNTVSKVDPASRWLLRVREPAPGLFAAWLAAHFPDDYPARPVCRQVGGQWQTQFSGRYVQRDRDLLARDLPLPVAVAAWENRAAHGGPSTYH